MSYHTRRCGNICRLPNIMFGGSTQRDGSRVSLASANPFQLKGNYPHVRHVRVPTVVPQPPIELLDRGDRLISASGLDDFPAGICGTRMSMGTRMSGQPAFEESCRCVRCALAYSRGHVERSSCSTRAWLSGTHAHTECQAGASGRRR